MSNTMQWVKASERLPMKSGYYHVRVLYIDTIYPEGIQFSVTNQRWWENDNVIEWLEELESGGGMAEALEVNEIVVSKSQWEGMHKDMDMALEREKNMEKVIEIKEAERKKWANMCIKKQQRIETLEAALKTAIDTIDMECDDASLITELKSALSGGSDGVEKKENRI